MAHWCCNLSKMNGLLDAKIESLVVGGAGQRFKGNDFRDLRKPGVYVFLQNGLPLYVGMSKMLLGRVGHKHRQAERAINECDEVLLYPCVSEEAAKELETLLIGKLHPKYNQNQFGAFLTKYLGVARPRPKSYKLALVKTQIVI